MASQRRRGAKGRQSGFAGLLLFALLALLVGVLLKSQVFIVRNIQVEGVKTVSAGDVVRKAGLTLGGSIFAADEGAVRRNFEHEGLVAFERLERRLPGTLRLIVRERERSAVVNYLGVALVIDENGYVIEQLGEMPSYNLTVVTGVRASSYQVGRRLESDVPLQVDSLLKVVLALNLQEFADRTSELNVADLDNMYLMERGGMMIKIGDDTMLAEKLLWAKSVLDQQLYPQGIFTGILDVSSGNSAVHVAD
jgi:cell division septal protein FtsQ